MQLPKNMATMSGDDERGRLERRPPWTISIDIPANSGECAEDPSAGEGDYSEVAAPGGEKDVSDSRVLTGRQPGFASRQAGDSLPSTRQKSQMSLLEDENRLHQKLGEDAKISRDCALYSSAYSSREN